MAVGEAPELQASEAVPGAPQESTPSESAVIDVANRVITIINSNDLETLLEISLDVGDNSRNLDVMRNARRRYGKVLRIGKITMLGARTARMTIVTEQGEAELFLSLSPTRGIAFMNFVDKDPVTAVLDRNKVSLILPFREEWFVGEGGKTATRNLHLRTERPEGKCSIDFIIYDTSRYAFKGRGLRNEDYYCYEKEILCPGDSTVVAAIDGVPDNQPGMANSSSASGNTIVLKHSPNEFSVLAHLRRGSIKSEARRSIKGWSVSRTLRQQRFVLLSALTLSNDELGRTKICDRLCPVLQVCASASK